MEYLKLLNISGISTLTAIVFIVVIGINFFKLSEPERLFESNQLNILRKIITELIIFLIITVVLTSSHTVGDSRPWLMFINLFFMLISLTLGYSYSDFKNSKFQISINRFLIRIFGQKSYKYFVFFLILIHSTLIIYFYNQSISLLIDFFNTYYKLNHTNSLSLLLEVMQKNKLNLYLYLGFSFIMFLFLRQTYMHPINKITRSFFQTNQRKNIRLSNGEIFKNMYVYQSSDSKFVIVSVEDVLSNSIKHYHINKDKIEYIESISSSFDK